MSVGESPLARAAGARYGMSPGLRQRNMSGSRRSLLPGSTRLQLQLLLLALLSLASQSLCREVCSGIENKLTILSNVEDHYNNLRKTYNACEVVMGNLEITFLEEHHDVSFLQSIQEVSGYVLIALNKISKIPLQNLRIIRGHRLYDDKFALVILSNYKRKEKIGLSELHLQNLTEILSGTVKLSSNPQLCYLQTIQWDDILENATASSMAVHFTARNCPKCHSQCQKAACWGPGVVNCQKFTKKICADQCSGRCMGPQPSDCCHIQCAAGCTGPREHDCLACRKFIDGDTCKESCPHLVVYNTITYQMERNPNGKYSFGSSCVEKCPHNYAVTDHGSCVRACSPGTYEVDEDKIRKCKRCEGPCPKDCSGIGVPPLKDVMSINSTNIDSFRNCTKINGNVVILEVTFKGDSYSKAAPLHLAKLEVFRTVREITGYFLIQSWPDNYTDLQVFENLEIIRGRTQHHSQISFAVVNLGIGSLGLRSLKEISDGYVRIINNKKLCYVQTLDWLQLFKSTKQSHSVTKNKPERECTNQSEVCSPLCSVHGCWGPGPLQCFSCRNYTRGRMCVEKCKVFEGKVREYVEAFRCFQCDAQCKPQNGSETCSGSGNRNCTECANFKDGLHCVKSCPSGISGENNTLIWKYPNENKLCQLCHPNCTQGCKGPELQHCEQYVG